MSVYGSGSHTVLHESPASPIWVRVLLGAGLVLAGVFVLADVVLATLISARVIGLIAVVAGAFEIVHAFWTKGWGGFVWQILLGLLYIAFGVVLFDRPVAGALMLTYFLGFALVASGLVRILLSFKYWTEAGWMMLMAGLFGLAAGVVILMGTPTISLWLLGFLLGVDLIVHGLAWISYACAPASGPVRLR
jgi:uncharacterized membrane protein HdeD (DUF308 family)